VTAACVVELARRSHARFVLLGRTPLAEEPDEAAGIEGSALKAALLQSARARGERPRPADLARRAARIEAAREVNAALAAVFAAGGQARYVAVDVQDEAAVIASLLPVTEQWGPVTALVHAAGVIADRRLADKDDASWDRVVTTKLQGLRALLGACPAPLRALVLFSSVAARCGNQGQCDYAAANEVLNKVARAYAADHPDCLVRSLGWGPWRGGMVTPELEAHFDRLGVPLVPLGAGAAWFADELSAPGAEVECVLGGRPRPESLLDEGTSRQLRAEVVVSQRTHPHLAGHAIEGMPVVPVVQVLEWFARACRQLRPDLAVRRVRDLRVFKGLTLPAFGQAGDRFAVTARQLSNGEGAVVALELTDAVGRRRYAAEAELVERLDDSAAPAPAPSLDDWGGAAIYGDVLFHTAPFQVIAALEGASEHGLSARLRGLADGGFASGPWVTDLAAFDGGLQLALLWAQRALGGAALPTSIAEVVLFADGPAPGPVRCVLEGQRRSARAGRADVVFLDGDGRRFAEFRGVEVHLRPAAAATRPAAPA
jgi:NAD(P)-dependent dehydrogenase (short-subunit alcohol dehydrogenase family)